MDKTIEIVKCLRGGYNVIVNGEIIAHASTLKEANDILKSKIS